MPLFRGTEMPDGSFSPIVRVDVVLRRRDQPLHATAVIDSGADRTIVPRVLVEAGGVAWDGLPGDTNPDGSPRLGRGVGSAPVEMRVCRGRVRWRTTTVCEVFLVADMGPNAPVLLGRSDFFGRFDVTFRWSDTPPSFEIEPASG